MYCTLQWLTNLHYTLQWLTLTCIVLSKVFCFSQYFLLTCIVSFHLTLLYSSFVSQLFASYLYCIVFQSVSLGYFSRGLNTHSMFIYAIFLQLYRQIRFPNCPYKIYDIYNVLTFLLAFLTHFGTYGQ